METGSRAGNQHRSLIEKLPVEMLLEIFEYLDSWCIRRCSEVCVTFFHLTLRSQFKKFFKLTMTEEFLSSNCGIGKLFAPGKRTKRNFEHLTLRSVTFERLPFAKNFFMRLGGEITEIELEGSFFIPLMVKSESEGKDQNFRKNILKNFSNLENLVIKDNDINALQYFPPSLKEIYVSEPFFMEANKDLFVKEKGAVNLEKLIYSNLIYDDEEVFKRTEGIKNFVNELDRFGLDFFENDWNILEQKAFDITHVTGVDINELSSVSFEALYHLSRLKTVKLNFDEGVDCFSDHDQKIPSFSHVKNLKLYFSYISVCSICIRNVIASFTGLTKLELKGNFTDQQIRLIFSNMPKLEYLELRGRIPQHIFDSTEHIQNSIEELKNLQHILIYDKFTSYFSTLSNDCLLQFSPLPNLKTFRFHQSNGHKQFTIDGIRNLVRKCPSISTFSLNNCDLTDQMVREMLSGWHQLTTLILPSISLDKETWNFAKANCRFLTYVAVSFENDCLLFSQKCSLFENISSLKVIKSGFKVVSRIEYHNQEVYLEHHPHTILQLKRKHQRYQSQSNKRQYTSKYNARHSSLKFIYEETDDEEDLEEEENGDDSDSSDEEEIDEF